MEARMRTSALNYLERKEAKGILALVALNKIVPKAEMRKSIVIGRLKTTYHWRSRKNLWGRFGGGWNWELGLQIGGTTVILNCLIFSLTFTWAKRAMKQNGN
jgi:hypothetical protein